MHFRINFLKPGQAIPSYSPLYMLKKKFSSAQKTVANQLITSVGTSITGLALSFTLLIFSSVFFYFAVYTPRERSLVEQATEIKKLQALVAKMTKQRQEEQARRDMIKARINQLIRVKNKTTSWTDKLKAIKRNIVSGLWLTSLDVKMRKMKVQLSVDAEESKKKKKKRRRGKKNDMATKQITMPSQMRISLKGSTYSFLGPKPLKVIAKFMNDLVTDPVWEKHFDLSDWVITTSELDKDTVASLKDKYFNKELREVPKQISFTLELERKR